MRRLSSSGCASWSACRTAFSSEVLCKRSGRGRAKSSSFEVSASSRTVSSRMNSQARQGSSPGAKLSCTIAAELRITPSGLRTSWAMPAARRPIAASFSFWSAARCDASSARSCRSIVSASARARSRAIARRPTAKPSAPYESSKSASTGRVTSRPASVMSAPKKTKIATSIAPSATPAAKPQRS